MVVGGHVTGNDDAAGNTATNHQLQATTFCYRLPCIALECGQAGMLVLVSVLPKATRIFHVTGLAHACLPELILPVWPRRAMCYVVRYRSMQLISVTFGTLES